MDGNGAHNRIKNGRTPPPWRIEFNHATAREVAIAGSFNDWRPATTPMIAMGHGRWLKEVALAPGTYEYLLVADGTWMPDPSSTENVPNPFGGVNSLVTVPSRPPQATSHPGRINRMRTLADGSRSRRATRGKSKWAMLKPA